MNGLGLAAVTGVFELPVRAATCILCTIHFLKNMEADLSRGSSIVLSLLLLLLLTHKQLRLPKAVFILCHRWDRHAVPFGRVSPLMYNGFAFYESSRPDGAKPLLRRCWCLGQIKLEMERNTENTARER